MLIFDFMDPGKYRLIESNRENTKVAKYRLFGNEREL